MPATYDAMRTVEYTTAMGITRTKPKKRQEIERATTGLAARRGQRRFVISAYNHHHPQCLSGQASTSGSEPVSGNPG
jgi:hypothetical protein